MSLKKQKTTAASALSTYNFDTSGYVRIDTSVRRHAASGRLIDTSDKKETSSPKKK